MTLVISYQLLLLSIVILTTVTLCSAASQTVCSGASSRCRTRPAARLVTGTRRCDHITPLLRQLHWLPVRQRVNLKLALLVYKALHDATVAYLVDDCQLVSHAGRCRLRLADIATCSCPMDQHSVRRPELCSHWTATLEQSASQDSPARQ